MMNEFIFRCSIISLDGKPRNSNLISDLKMLMPNVEIFIVGAIRPIDIDSVFLNSEIKKTELLLGRRVVPTEIAIRESHRKALESFIPLEGGWHLILEDDVKITLGNLVRLQTEIQKINSSDPQIISLCSPFWSVWKKEGRNWKALFPPACASAYLINQQAARIATKGFALGLADWPTWSKKVKFIHIPNDVFSISTEHSHLEEDRENAKKINFKIKALISPREFLAVPHFDRFRYIVFYPWLWKKAKNKIHQENNNSIFLV